MHFFPFFYKLLALLTPNAVTKVPDIFLAISYFIFYVNSYLWPDIACIHQKNVRVLIKKIRNLKMFAFTHSAIRAYDTNSDVCWGSKKLFSSFSAILFPEIFKNMYVIHGSVVEVL